MMKKFLIVSFVFIFFSCNKLIDDNFINSTISQNEGYLKYESSISKLDSIFIPQYNTLSQNYPNPFSNQTIIKFSISTESFVNIKVLDSFRNDVANLIDKKLSPGYYSVMFSSSDLKNGIYYYKITTNEFVDTKEMLVISKN